MINKMISLLEGELDDIVTEEINSVEDELRCAIDKLINDKAYEITAEFHKRISSYGALKDYFEEEEFANEIEHKLREQIGIN